MDRLGMLRPMSGSRSARRGRGRLVTASLSLLLGTAGSFAIACGPREPEPPPRPHVVVLLVDTLRAQSLGTYGYGRPTSPHLDALAEESFLFEQARAQAPYTFPSVNSLLTGLPPSRFPRQPDRRMGIPEGVPSMAEILREEGYATVAISASPIVRKHPSRFNPHGGFDRGFDRFDDSCVWKDATCVNDHALRELDGLSGPFFLYLHYMDVHGPYRPPKTWARQFADPTYEGPEPILRGDPNPIARQIAEKGRFEPGEFSRQDVAHLRDLYDDEIAYFDSKLRELLDELDRRGLGEKTIVVLLADHGEEFLEHGKIKHCQRVYDTEIRTPLLIDLPSALEESPPRRITSPVANLDLLPTLLDYLEIEPPPDLAGTSLRSVMGGEAARGDGGIGDREAVVSSWAGLRAATDGRYKLIVHLRTGKARLYDLETDPGETTDLLAGDRTHRDYRAYQREARRLGGVIEHWVRTVEGTDGAEGPPRWDDDALDQLRALGYIQ